MADTALVFERYELLPAPPASRGGFEVRYTFRRCTGKRWQAVVDDYLISIRFRDALPPEWPGSPPSDLLLGLGMAMLSHVWCVQALTASPLCVQALTASPLCSPPLHLATASAGLAGACQRSSCVRAG